MNHSEALEKYPILLTDGKYAVLECDLQKTGLFFSKKFASEKEVVDQYKKLKKWRLFGMSIFSISCFIFLNGLFPIADFFRNLPLLAVGLASILMSYFTLESSNRSLRLFRLLSQNKKLKDQVSELCTQSPSVELFCSQKFQQGQPLRTYDISLINEIRMIEIENKNYREVFQ